MKASFHLLSCFLLPPKKLGGKSLEKAIEECTDCCNESPVFEVD